MLAVAPSRRPAALDPSGRGLPQPQRCCTRPRVHDAAVLRGTIEYHRAHRRALATSDAVGAPVGAWRDTRRWPERSARGWRRGRWRRRRARPAIAGAASNPTVIMRNPAAWRLAASVALAWMPGITPWRRHASTTVASALVERRRRPGRPWAAARRSARGRPAPRRRRRCRARRGSSSTVSTAWRVSIIGMQATTLVGAAGVVGRRSGRRAPSGPKLRVPSGA